MIRIYASASGGYMCVIAAWIFTSQKSELRPFRALAAALIQMKVQIRKTIPSCTLQIFFKASDILVDALMYEVILEGHFGLQLNKGTINTWHHFLYVACNFTPGKI